MPYKEVPKDHSEFGGGPGLIDPQSRLDRELRGHERMREIYAHNPADETDDPASTDLTDFSWAGPEG